MPCVSDRLNVRPLPRLLAFVFVFSLAIGLGLTTVDTACVDGAEAVRVFIFAGQSNMVGSDSKAQDIKRFPPFAGLETPQKDVRFWYCLGRQTKQESAGWVDLQPVNNIVGPELSFAREVKKHTSAPIAIIKCAAGGTHLGGDWNPDDPQGFKMYPLTQNVVRKALGELEKQGVQYRVEAVMWHQGENDMFNEEYMKNYGPNLENFFASWREDLALPKLPFYVGELCTKTIWGMDLRPRMYAISKGQRFATERDEHAEYVPTSHIGVEIGGGVGLHYHYGTLGQLEHGVNYAQAYLRSLGKLPQVERKLEKWPYAPKSKVTLFVLAGHRNMEGERAFVQQVPQDQNKLLADNPNIAYRYSLGGGYRVSTDWEPLGTVGYYDTFGPELSFAAALRKQQPTSQIAIAKFTHSGSQMNDWTPEGSMAKSRHIYPDFISFVKETIASLEQRDHEVEVAGIFYHVGENEMSMPPYRRQSPEWLRQTVAQSRTDLQMPTLHWFVSQQQPTRDKRVDSIDIVPKFEELAASDPHLTHIKAFSPPPQEKKLVLDTAGILYLGDQMAAGYQNHSQDK